MATFGNKKLNKKITDKFVLENETLKREVKPNPKDRIEIEVGDSKSPDFKPQFKLMRWNNEVNFSIRAEEHPQSVVETQDDKIVYKTPDYEVHQYDKPDAGEDGGFEFEWVLPVKPSTNVLKTTIQTKGLSFFYQPELTQEEIDEGSFRPENVVGSYAVYHKTKGGMNRSDGMEYKTGKAFHIYRPKAIDASGNESWGELHIDEQKGELTVTVDQGWLDKAAYPVIVDPTLGYTTIGGTVSNLGFDTVRSLQTFTMSENGTADSISFYRDGTNGAPVFRGVIYNDSDKSLVGNAGSEYQTELEWGVSIMGSEALVDGTDYNISAWIGTANYQSARYDAGAGINLLRDDLTYASSGNPNNPFVTDGTLADRNYSIYATYTASGGTDVTVNAGVVTASSSLPAPTVTTVQNATVSPGVLSVIFSGDPANVSLADIAGDVTANAGVVTITASLPSPSISGVANVSAGVISATLSLPTPTVSPVKNVSVSADVVTLTSSLPGLTVSNDSNASITPTPINLLLSLPTPSVTAVINNSLTADVVALTTSLPTPTTTADANETADVVTATLSLPTPSVSTVQDVSVSADVVTMTTVLPSPSFVLDAAFQGNSSWGLDINSFALIKNKQSKLPTWSTAGRPAGSSGKTGWNRQTNKLEIYDTDSGAWYAVDATQL